MKEADVQKLLRQQRLSRSLHKKYDILSGLSIISCALSLACTTPRTHAQSPKSQNNVFCCVDDFFERGRERGERMKTESSEDFRER